MHEIRNLIAHYCWGAIPYFWLLKMLNLVLDSYCYHLLNIIGTRERDFF